MPQRSRVAYEVPILKALTPRKQCQGKGFGEMGLGRLEPEAAPAAGDDRGWALGQPEIHFRPHAYQAPVK